MTSVEPGAPQVRKTRARKDEHLRINLAEDVTGDRSAGFDKYRFTHLALPEIDLAEVSTSTSLFGKTLRVPILISCMTGGTSDAARLNEVLADTAQQEGLAMGLGSGRVLLQDPNAPGLNLRRLAPDVPLLANIGAPQLNQVTGMDDCRRLLDLTGADALVLHLNPLQEALQPEGEPRFRGLLRQIEILCSSLAAPVVVKEVGSGLAADVVGALFEAGVTAVDVAGAGGTSWSEVERRRLTGVHEKIAGEFRSWGIPTAEAVVGARAVAGDRLVFASGGVRSGMDAAIALALGADLVGLAGPFIRAAALGTAATRELAVELAGVLRIVMFNVGARNLASFRAAPRLVRL
ncbi:MAG TPA: type 2 isopentenyl-diphosphate Delta-isomerase [Patescibacteria group bacterium]|nr:type 2 isopentenyl-diphosphate Delta-isomerase [Patescibacteria group bacterium]